MQGNKKLIVLIVYVITYGPKSSRFPLGDTASVKDSPPPPENFKRAQPLELPLLNSLPPPPPLISGGINL